MADGVYSSHVRVVHILAPRAGAHAGYAHLPVDNSLTGVFACALVVVVICGIWITLPVSPCPYSMYPLKCFFGRDAARAPSLAVEDDGWGFPGR